MKVYQTSDLHLEFGPLTITNDDNAEVLILGGDICVATPFCDVNKRLDEFHQFFGSVSELFPQVIYIMGNHEHYGGDFANTENILRESLSKYPNVHLLEKESIKIGDVTFIGGTMWADCNNSDPQTMMHLKYAMNDFRTVKNSNTPKIVKSVPIYKKDDNGFYIKDENGALIVDHTERQENVSNFSPEDSVTEHDKFLAYLRNVVEGKHDEKFFVCTHHAPSRLSTHEKYKHDHLMNGGFSTELFDFIADTTQIKVWSCGHTHHLHRYYIENTLVVCNPRGYVGYEKRATEFKPKLIDTDNLPSPEVVANDYSWNLC